LEISVRGSANREKALVTPPGGAREAGSQRPERGTGASEPGGARQQDAHAQGADGREHALDVAMELAHAP